MALRQKTSNLLRVIKNLIIVLVRYIHAVIGFIRHNFGQLSKYLAGKKLIVFVIFLLIGLSYISVVALLPGTHIFEGNLVVEEMSFTYNGQQPKLFLQSIRQIKSLETEGIQTLTLTGKFESQAFPQLNKIKSLKINLIDKQSKLIITPANLQTASEIDLNELRLQQNTKVKGLHYDFYRQRLAFSLIPQSTPKLVNQTNILKFYLGEQPLKISLEGHKLSDIKLPELQDSQTPLEFTFNPDNKEFNLNISQDNTIYLTASNLPEYSDEQWFQSKIVTKDVIFQRLERSGDIRDDLAISTIIEGKVRMAEQEREITQNQFLMAEKPNMPLNIELIRHIQIVPKKGLEVRFAGKTQEIKIGLDKDFPVSSIKGSRLDSFLPRDAVIALFSFAAGTITSLLSYVIENAAKPDSK
ncbi:hypothetical protein [Halotia branconii]|uniref:Uncharacterized protein n=1 Tax=Halotia branconii CENA392 TaxID=1539056 RepID=A0AAJ6PBL4_9CYAN|nr:hypothetical protein [Halotia branconii]WGV27871.1 hypothetical protein QI031_10480 [Halotia branconii CENA392]